MMPDGLARAIAEIDLAVSARALGRAVVWSVRRMPLLAVCSLMFAVLGWCCVLHRIELIRLIGGRSLAIALLSLSAFGLISSIFSLSRLEKLWGLAAVGVILNICLLAFAFFAIFAVAMIESWQWTSD